jgi:hypothetical protein
MFLEDLDWRRFKLRDLLAVKKAQVAGQILTNFLRYAISPER